MRNMSLKAHDSRTECKFIEPTTNKANQSVMCARALGNCAAWSFLPLESDLLALEATAAATETTTTTATTARAATTTTAAETATASTTASATAAKATAATLVVTEVTLGLGGRVVQADIATIHRLSVELLESHLGIIDRVEGHITEALAATTLPVIWLAMLEIEKTK